jgi:hypothetical protein
MAIYWNDIEILQVLDECEQRDPSGISRGLTLMQEVARKRGLAIAEPDYETFVREMFVLLAEKLVTWQEPASPGHVAPPDPNRPNDYLQRIKCVALTVAGRDRARGQIVKVPLPNLDEDDGRMIRGSSLEDVSNIIGAAYSLHQAARFLLRRSSKQPSGGLGVADLFLVEVARDDVGGALA